MSQAVAPKLLSIGNLVGSPGSTFAGIALLATPILHVLASTTAMPVGLAGWAQMALGVLAMFGL